MASSKTTHLNLNLWEKTDPIRMSEFNENFTVLDQAVTELSSKIITGSYVGNGSSSREINLGFRPLLVMVLGHGGGGANIFRAISFVTERGDFLIDTAAGYTSDVTITDAGFITNTPLLHNVNGQEEFYFALKP